ncbi:MAG TPA: hypothetical protein VFU87_04425, partial [Sphingomicrobium sp.]|nr:hypothetical protein [Sphingomicrobium sp.]
TLSLRWVPTSFAAPVEAPPTAELLSPANDNLSRRGSLAFGNGLVRNCTVGNVSQLAARTNDLTGGTLGRMRLF